MTEPLEELESLDLSSPIWDRFYTVHPLVLVGTREASGAYDLAPKHMAFPLGWTNRFGFICTPDHGTYRNAKREGVFTVSYPTPSQVLLASLAAMPRCADDAKPSLEALETFEAEQVDGVYVKDATLYFACETERIVDGFGENSLIAGRIVAAHARDAILRSPELDGQEIIHETPLLAYLHPTRFARIEESYSFPFPADFHR